MFCTHYKEELSVLNKKYNESLKEIEQLKEENKKLKQEIEKS